MCCWITTLITFEKEFAKKVHIERGLPSLNYLLSGNKIVDEPIFFLRVTMLDSAVRKFKTQISELSSTAAAPFRLCFVRPYYFYVGHIQ